MCASARTLRCLTITSTGLTFIIGTIMRMENPEQILHLFRMSCLMLSSASAARFPSRSWPSHLVSIRSPSFADNAATVAFGLLFTHLFLRERLAFFAHLVSSYTFPSVVDIDTKVLELLSP
jgi:hypothetical protein